MKHRLSKNAGLAILAFLICSCQKSVVNNPVPLPNGSSKQVLSPAALANERTPAFPGAEGFGRFATGARGATDPAVYTVTNLEDSGPGSFRDAVSQPGRFVVFAVTGIIRLKSTVAVAPNTTIAGQTAPGKGVVIYGRKVSFTGASNTIARNLRIRLGSNAGSSRSDDASGIANGKHMIFDHVSFTWGQDEVFSINWDNKHIEPDSITLQHCIVAQGLNKVNHSAGGLIQTHGRISILKCLYASNKTRNPKVKGINEFVNNIVYNWGNLGNPKGHTVSGEAYIMGGSEGVSNVNIINNYFIQGPLTPDEPTPFSRGTGTFYLYTAGNYFDRNKNGLLDGTEVSPDSTGYPGLEPGNFMPVPYAYPYSTPVLSATDAFKYVAKNAGALYPHRDDVDKLLIAELQSLGTAGLYVYTESDLPLVNGGLGDFPYASPHKDSDGDGIPDSWEKKLGLNAAVRDALQPNSADPRYLNIEVYINALVRK
ncbi:hypothetical protein LL912_05100 [Niabella sp. CC-SYL272]|uniref:pectate lyase family protein n=1 Tax=Niabella agricola TaxID=2891571 RepID=UPI001F29D289|nr:hypothetical protein [Niabella agricola]MCF3108146.1 hypothetical protein [Niabella agricola]